MSKQRIEEMLQDCLDGYEAGLTPEECLSAYNGERIQLEPLLRQALSLRVAYANSPSEEFRTRAREKLMFAAGRDVSQALTVQPNPEYVAQTRERYLNAAGAAAQEVLRDVPPPRLAFWMNARRRLLEAATLAAPRPRPRYALALRYGLSSAVVVFALAIAILAPFTGNSPQSADAQLAILEQQVSDLEEQTLSGQELSTSVLLSVTKKLNEIASTLEQGPAQEPVLERATRLEGLHARTEVLKQAPLDEPALAQATQKQLDEAAEKLREFAASVEQPTQTALLQPTGPAGSSAAGSSPTPAASATAGPTSATLSTGQLRKTSAVDDSTASLTWDQITTSNVSFLVPNNWLLLNVSGESSFSSNLIAIQTDGPTPIVAVVSAMDGRIVSLISGTQVILRDGGPSGKTIAPEFLAALGEVGIALHHFVLSVKVTAAP